MVVVGPSRNGNTLGPSFGEYIDPVRGLEEVTGHVRVAPRIIELDGSLPASRVSNFKLLSDEIERLRSPPNPTLIDIS